MKVVMSMMVISSLFFVICVIIYLLDSWEKTRIEQIRKKNDVLIEWKPSKKIWYVVLNSSLEDNVKHSIISIIFISFVLLAAFTKIPFPNSRIFIISSIAFLTIIFLAWQQVKPLKYCKPYRYILTRKGIWILGDGGLRDSSGFYRWEDFDYGSIIKKNHNFIQLYSPVKNITIDIILPLSSNKHVENIITKNISGNLFIDAQHQTKES